MVSAGEFDAAYESLAVLAKALAARVEDDRTEVRGLLAGTRTIPQGTANPVAAAAEAFEPIRAAAAEVAAAAERVARLIRAAGRG
jgi:hypothetical protein